VEPAAAAAALPESGTPRHPWAEVPACAAERVRPVAVDAAGEIIDAVRAEVAEYALSMDGEFGRRIRQGVSVALGQFVDLLGTDDDLPETRTYFELGRVEHRHGRTMDALQAAYRVGSRVMWRRVSSRSAALGLEPDAVFRLAEALFAYVEQLAAASVAGYAHEQSMTAGSRQARRHALVERLCRTPALDPPELERLAGEAQWTVPRTVAALLVDESVLARIGRRLPADVVGSVIDRVGVVLVPDPTGPGRADVLADAVRDSPAVLGPTVTPAATVRSVARARAAWPRHRSGQLTGGEPEGTGLVRADDHLLALILHADSGLTADLVAQRLEPLLRMTSAARDRAVKTLSAWFDAHGDVAEAATALHVHPQTVRYRLARLKESFAGMLDDPVARLEVALALRAGPVPEG